MYFLSARYFLDHESFNRAEFIAPEYFSDGFDYLIAVTHRWQKPLNAHDAHLNYLEVKNRIAALVDEHQWTPTQIERVAVFYDYSSIYQNRTANDLVLYGVYLQMHGSTAPYDTAAFVRFAARRREEDLQRLYPMLLTADEVYMTKYHQRDYYARCWCLVEVLAGRLRGTLVDRAGPFHVAENLQWHGRFTALADRLEATLEDSSAVASFQERVRSASCTVESDRQQTMEYVPAIVERVRQYRADPEALVRDRGELQSIVRREKGDAVAWSRRNHGQEGTAI